MGGFGIRPGQVVKDHEGRLRLRCTCLTQSLYYGSYYCDPKKGWCRGRRNMEINKAAKNKYGRGIK